MRKTRGETFEDKGHAFFLNGEDTGKGKGKGLAKSPLPSPPKIPNIKRNPLNQHSFRAWRTMFDPASRTTLVFNFSNGRRFKKKRAQCLLGLYVLSYNRPVGF